MRRPSLPALSTLLVVLLAVVFVFLELDPRLLLSTTTTTGGDTGAHVAAAAFLKSQLLPHGHLTGWDPQWYDGFPLYTFYFPLPDAVAAVLGYVIPFSVAFKIATALGSLTLPVAAWAFGRLAGLERPRPAVLAVATLPFLFAQSWTIYGGNIYSTMAGEYAYSLGLSIALVFLGVVARGLRTGGLRGRGALLLAATILSHLVAALFAVAGALVLFGLLRPSWRRLWWLVSTGLLGFLLTAWWAVPFVLQLPYTTNMGWVNVHTWVALFAPGSGTGLVSLFDGSRWALWLAGLGTVVALVQRRMPVVLFSVLGVASYLAAVLDPQGKLYNARFVPLWWLCIYLLAGSLVAEIGVAVAWLWRTEGRRWWAQLLRPSSVTAGGERGARLAFAGSGLTLPSASAASSSEAGGGGAAPPTERPSPTRGPSPSGRPSPSEPELTDPGPTPIGTAAQAEPPGWGGSSAPTRWGPPPRRSRWAPGALAVPVVALLAALAVVYVPLNTSLASFMGVAPSSVPSWVRWNYSGYQSKPAYPELKAVIALADKAAHRYGCGRAMWEYSSNLDRFGTPMALMLLPMLTNGCVNTQEGLFFESSATTPYHFIDQNELSAAPSDAMVGLPYGQGPNVALGVQHLQLLGVRYLLASSPAVQAQAGADPALSLIGSTGPWSSLYEGRIVTTTWKLYLVHGAAEVSPLTRQPEVLTGVGQSQTQWLPPALRWYDNPGAWSTELVAAGPRSWARTSTHATAPGAPEPPVHVTAIHDQGSRLSFHVDRVGVPVLVKVSYFPDWHVTGAKGPWRAMPNLMVVVPTSHQVTLTYGSSGPGDLGLAMTVVGGLGLVAVAWRGRRAVVG